MKFGPLKFMKMYTITLLILFGSNLFGFSWKKCTSQHLGSANYFGVTTSSAQFTSSTGGCAMIGQIDHDKKVFIAHNAEFLQIDIARGAGEYLHNFVSISKCNESKLGPILKKNYQRIFSNDDLNPEAIYKKIDDVIRENNQTGDLCSVGVS